MKDMFVSLRKKYYLCTENDKTPILLITNHIKQ